MKLEFGNCRDIIYFSILSCVFGGACVYAIYLEKAYPNYYELYHIILNKCPNIDDIICALFGSVATLYGIGVTISISIVSEHLKPYGSEAVSKYFKNEFEFKFQLYSWPLLMLVCLIYYWFEPRGLLSYVFIFSLFFYVIYRFIKFIYLIIRYSVATDDVVFNKARNDVKKNRKAN